MKGFMIVLGLDVAMAMTIGCGHGADHRTDVQAEAQAIQNLEKQMNQDCAAKDADKIAGYYADDAVLMPPGLAPSVGRESIRATLRQMAADPAMTLKFSTAKIDVAESGDLGYTRGAYVMTMTDPQTKKVIHDQGSYVTTYRKQTNGAWKVVADIASSEVMPVQLARTEFRVSILLPPPNPERDTWIWTAAARRLRS